MASADGSFQLVVLHRKHPKRFDEDGTDISGRSSYGSDRPASSYIANFDGKLIGMFSINWLTGALAPLTPATISCLEAVPQFP
jgi:hypothetical protein